MSLENNASQSLDDTILLPVLPGYTVHSVLGQGGFATVYLATQLSLDRRVALKIMNPAYAADADLCERFVREGRDLAAVSEHDSIVTVFDVGSHGNLYYIAMQYLPGPTLKEMLRSNEPYLHPLYIISRVADALSYAHAKGLIHRDIKPANILFNARGEAVLSDFGIAKKYNRDEQLTQMGQMVGTENYMSPEQALMSEHLDGRSDLYSLGVVFYETLTRRLPYQANSSESVLHQHIKSPIPELPEIQAEYQPLIDGMMAKNREDRYATASELIKDINSRFFTSQSEQTLDPGSKSGFSRAIFPVLVVLAVLAVGLAASFFISTDNLQPAGKVTLSEEQQTEIADSLELAELNELLGRISTPPGSNALELYQHVLVIDPGNEKASAALQRLQSR